MNPSGISGLNASEITATNSNIGNATNPPVLPQAEYKETLDTADALQQNKEEIWLGLEISGLLRYFLPL